MKHITDTPAFAGLRKIVQEHMEHNESFVITRVSQSDLESEGYDVTKVNATTMKEVANLMAEAYGEDAYWDHLQQAADYLKIPRKRISKEQDMKEISELEEKLENDSDWKNQEHGESCMYNHDHTTGDCETHD